MKYLNRLLKAIPGGAHTYSRGYDQYPANAPQILSHGSGAYIYDPDGKEYLDYGMALRAVTLGYANSQINAAAIRQIELGNNLTKPSMIELEAAELLIDTINSVEMVKFTKNGSTATTAAVKLSRAFTGRTLVARCSEHPFFSYDDWFIGSTPLTRGIPAFELENTKLFHYNNIESLNALLEQHPEQIACVILEAATTEHPAEDFLHRVKELCHKHGAVFILDEMITGFRWHLQGAQEYYNIEADLCTFGKAMANGFSVAAIAGKKEIMQLGSIENSGQERLFLLSTTHGAEMCGMGAFVENIKFMKANDVIGHLWNYGQRLINGMNEISRSLGLEKSFIAGGVACSPYYMTLDQNGQNCLGLRTLFAQEMIKNNVLMPWIAISYAHGEKEFNHTMRALENSLKVYRKAFEEGYSNYLAGDTIKPVFRRYN
ncbi:MAG: glutamate-1-semialdehyde 2,1-aminomutase [Victivallales bacterium]|nr:glutamate-1-semialdehyde 2,1-aminomutase [Victivallales bacterium]